MTSLSRTRRRLHIDSVSPNQGSGDAAVATLAHTLPWLYIIFTIALCLPSIVAWTLVPFDVGPREFDPFLRQIGTPKLGRIVHTVGFATVGCIYVQLASRAEPLPRWIIPSAVVVWLLSVPWISPDVFFYLSKGWMQVHFGADPYTVTIEELSSSHNEELFLTVVPALRSVLGNYGPLFQALSAGIAALSLGDPKLGLVVFKLLSIVALFAIFRVLLLLARTVGIPSGAMANWFWLNPLLLSSFVGAAHNDVYPVLLQLTALYLGLRQRFLIAGVLLGLAISVKLIGVFLVPALLLICALQSTGRRETLRRLLVAGSSAVLGITMGLAFRPTSVGYLATWVQNSESYFRSTIHLLLVPFLGSISPKPEKLSLLVGQFGFVLLGGYRLLNRLRERSGAPTPRDVLEISLELMLLGQLLAMQMMNEWYLLGPICVALVIAGCDEMNWVKKVSIFYMPLVVWAIIGDFATTIALQLSIVFGFATATLQYLWQKR